MTSKSDIPHKGEVLAGKYQVEEVLGAGGMGVVVAARHVALRQRVALKFLLPAAIQLPGAAARFLREAQAAVAIQSEHVARVLDVGTLESGAPYMVMEHLSGVDLARHLQATGPLAIHDALDFTLQASEALAEAHTLGIVHRDLKPANLFLARRAEGSPLVKVLDFGLSKMVSPEGAPEASLTAANVVAGSPHYMSPEQVRSLKHVDARTDVWALGVILYELLTGRRPFEGPTVTAICAAVVADAPLPPSRHRPDLPPGLEALVLACLEKDATRRVQSVAQLAAGLAPFAPKRSEPLTERIQRLQPFADGASAGGEVAKTLPWQPVPAQAPRTSTVPEAPLVVAPGVLPAPPAPAPPTPPDAAVISMPLDKPPPTQPLVEVAPGGGRWSDPGASPPDPGRQAAPSVDAGVLSGPGVPQPAEGGTGPIQWATSRPPGMGRRKVVWMGSIAAAILATASLLGLVALRDKGGSAGELAPSGEPLSVGAETPRLPSPQPLPSVVAGSPGVTTLPTSTAAPLVGTGQAGSGGSTPPTSTSSAASLVLTTAVPKGAPPSTTSPKSTAPSTAFPPTPPSASSSTKKKPNPLDLNK